MEIIRKIYAFLIDGVETLLIAAAIFLVIYAFLFRPFNVSGESMYPNFHNGEYVITNLIGFEDFKIYHASFGTLKLGDVVVFIAPPDPTKDYIKRVIGVIRTFCKVKRVDIRALVLGVVCLLAA